MLYIYFTFAKLAVVELYPCFLSKCCLILCKTDLIFNDLQSIGYLFLV